MWLFGRTLLWHVFHLVWIVHRCGPGGSMRACHAAGPGSIPGRDKFPGWGFFGVFPHCKTNIGKLRPPSSPNIICPSLSSSLIIHYGRQWPEMLTRPEASNIQIYIWSKFVIIYSYNDKLPVTSIFNTINLSLKVLLFQECMYTGWFRTSVQKLNRT